MLLLTSAVVLAMIGYTVYRMARVRVLLRYFPALLAPEPRAPSLVVDPLLRRDDLDANYRSTLNMLVESHRTLLSTGKLLATSQVTANNARRLAEKSERKLAKARNAWLFRGKRVAAAEALYSLVATERDRAVADETRNTADRDAAKESIRKSEASLPSHTTLPEGGTRTGGTVERNVLTVMFHDDVKPKEIRRVLAQYGLRVIDGVAKFSLFLVRSETPPGTVTDEGEATRLQALVDLLLDDANVEAAVQNMPFTAYTESTPVIGPLSATDPLVLTGFPKAWDHFRTHQKGGPIDIGVLDEGFLDDNQDVTVTPIDGKRPIRRPHGMQMASIIGALHNNDVGIKGAAPSVNLIGAAPSKPLSFDFLKLLEKLVSRKPPVAVINASVGYNWSKKSLDADALREVQQRVENDGKIVRTTLLGASRTILVTAAGNDSTDKKPADAKWASPYNWAALGDESDELGRRSDNVIVVEALDASGTGRLPMSNTNGMLKAIGERVFTLAADMILTRDSGTSAAAPLVASTVAMMLQLNPKLTVAQVKENLGVGSADPRLDALAAVQKSTPARRRILGNPTANTPPGGTRL
jgi:hypothetical protein